MIELLATTDPVRLSYLRALLADAEIETFVLGAESPWPGSFPSRLMVGEADEALARRVLTQAGEAED